MGGTFTTSSLVVGHLVLSSTTGRAWISPMPAILFSQCLHKHNLWQACSSLGLLCSSFILSLRPVLGRGDEKDKFIWKHGTPAGAENRTHNRQNAHNCWQALRVLDNRGPSLSRLFLAGPVSLPVVMSQKGHREWRSSLHVGDVSRRTCIFVLSSRVASFFIL